jgi:hypothetical protein
LLVQRDNSLPGAVLADFAPLGAGKVLLTQQKRVEVLPLAPREMDAPRAGLAPI